MTKIVAVSKMLWRSRQPILGIWLVLLLSPIFFFFMDRAKVLVLDIIGTNSLVQRRLRLDIRHAKGLGCVMPQLDPFAKDIVAMETNFTQKLPTVSCEGKDWVHCHNSECAVTKEVLRTVSDIVCIYRYIIPVDDRNYYFSGAERKLGASPFILKRTDHVKVDCSGRDLNRSSMRIHWSGYKGGFREMQRKVSQDHKGAYNVMILSFDSTSRNGFMRTMRKSYKYLTEKLDAVILNGYNVVGDGATGTIYPILTGKHEWELFDNEKKKEIDPKKIIFSVLKEHGYRTAYFENMPWLGVAEYRVDWFHSQLDHYLRTLLLACAGRGQRSNRGLPADYCIGASTQYQLLIDMAKEFLQVKGKKFCLTSIIDLEFENYNVEPSRDEVVLSFLQTLSSSKALEDTLILIMGDHGSRFPTSRNTRQGRIEERMPLMAIILPQKLIEARPTSLTTLTSNAEVLTTPFDIHATILDVLDLKHKMNTDAIPGATLTRSLSLLEPIPKYRTCGEAGVMPHWCACSAWVDLKKTDKYYEEAIEMVAGYLDLMTQEVRAQCARRHLISTEWVIYHKSEDDFSTINYIHVNKLNFWYARPTESMKTLNYYQIKMIMSPGRSEFECTLVYNEERDYFIVTPKDISRVNPYEEESECISNSHPYLSKYCYCKNKLVKPKGNKTLIV